MSYSIPTNGHQAGAIPMSHVNYENAADIPIGNPKEQTFMWQQQQQQNYLVDSGINSGVSTQAPSISGQEDNFENEEVFDWDQNGFTHAGDLQMDPAHPQEVRAAMYDERIEMPSTPFHPNQSNIAEPAQIQLQQQQQLILNQPNYQLDTEKTIQMISKLIKMLNDKDQVVVNVAALTIAQLPLDDVKRHALITQPRILHLVVAATMNNPDLQLRRCTAQILNDLSHHPEGLLAILKSGSIPAVVELLSSPVESILFLAIVTLHNLLLQQKGSKEEVLRADGLQKLMSLLQRDNAKFLAIVTDCLHSLAHNDKQSKLVILAHQGPVELVRIMRTYNYEKLLWTTSRVLKVLSICSKNKTAIVEAGGMQALALHLNHQSQRLVMNCLWALRNLSDAATKELLDDLLYQLVVLLGSDDIKHVVTCTAGIVSNLTCNNQRNKVLVFQAGGVEALLKLIRHFGNFEELAEPTICALRHLTSRHPESEKAQNAVRLNFGLPVIINLLQLQCRWPLIKAAVGLIRNLALCPDNHPLMREHHTISRLSQLLIRSYQDITNNVTADGIRMEDIVEGTVGALHILASDSLNRAIFRGHEVVINIFVQLLSYGNENIQRVAAGVLYELAVDKEGAEIIERFDAVKLLRNLCSSKNDGVAMNAAAVLSRISEHKPKERMSLDAVQSIFDAEEVGSWAQDLASILYDDQLRQGVQGCHGSSSFNANHGLDSSFAQGSIGFDQLPIDPLQDFEIGNHPNTNYDLMDSMDIG